MKRPNESTASSSLSSLDVNGEVDARSRTSKRRKIDEPYQKRVAKACTSCRRLKEKCDGGTPCSRCIRYRRTCGANIPSAEIQESETTAHRNELEERNAHLEAIAIHFLGTVPNDMESLSEVSQAFRTQEQECSGHAISEHASGNSVAPRPGNMSGMTKLSNSTFTCQLQHEVERRLDESGIQSTSNSTPNNFSISRFLPEATFDRAKLPPKDVALFLCKVYFDFAQSTVIWVEQSWIEAKIKQLYSWSFDLSCNDRPWICSVLAIMAIAVKFAHLASVFDQPESSNGSSASNMMSDYDASSKFDRLAADLLIDALHFPCIDTMQAVVLLGNLALTSNNPNLAYIYFGMATRLSALIEAQGANKESGALQEQDPRYQHLRHICFAWSGRIGVIHGLESQEISASSPTLPPLSPDVVQQQISPQARNDLFIQLTDWLMRFDRNAYNFTRSVQSSQSLDLNALMDFRALYKNWWSEHAISRIPVLQLNRHTAPMHICYHLNLICVGRPFIFHSSGVYESVEKDNAIAELVDDAEYSAYEVIDICSMLENSTGLTASHHVEFDACRAAVVVMLAQSLIGRCHLFRGKLQQGLDLVRRISRGSAELSSEIDTIAASVERLAPHLRNQKYKSVLRSCGEGDTGYKRFRFWARKESSTLSFGGADSETLTIARGDIGGLDEILENDLLDPALFAFDPAGFGDDVGPPVY